MAKDKSNKFAVLETGGKQYLVKSEDKISVERLEKPAKGLARRATAEGDIISFDKILLLTNGAELKIGNPYIGGAKVPGKLLGEKRREKITHLRYHNKTRQAIKKGHRQIYSEVIIGEF